MNKNLYIIGGTMGVGKTTVCQLLNSRMDNSVFLDGDWCWYANPFQVTEETKQMVMDNIGFLLNSFIRCSAYKNVIFCWVMHEQSIIDDLLSKIDTSECNVRVISLLCDESSLRERIESDIIIGKREADSLDRSIERIPMYNELNTIKIDTSALGADEVAVRIIRL